MNIFWHGQTCFKITYQKGKDGLVNILIDPFDKETGLKPPKTNVDILINGSSNESETFLVDGPGEYDVKGAYIHGLAVPDKKDKGSVVYTIDVEGVRICHLGLLNQTEFSPGQLEEIGDVDILLVPVGGGEAIDSKGAIKVMSQIEPKIIIPMYYKVKGLKPKLEDVGAFLKALGIKSLPAVAKLSIKKKDITQDEAKIIVLEP